VQCKPGWECTIQSNWSDVESTVGRVLENVLRGLLGSELKVYLGVSSGLTWECTVKQAASLLSRVIGSVRESMLGSVLIKVLGCVLSSPQSPRVDVCHQVALEVSLRSYWVVYFRMCTVLTGDHLECVLASIGQASWECAIVCNHEYTSTHIWK